MNENTKIGSLISRPSDKQSSIVEPKQTSRMPTRIHCFQVGLPCPCPKIGFTTFFRIMVKDKNAKVRIKTTKLNCMMAVTTAAGVPKRKTVQGNTPKSSPKTMPNTHRTLVVIRT
jgi:hypothetical protein